MARPAKSSELKSGLLFLGKFLRHGNKIASVWPSSRQLAEATIEKIDFGKARTIVEFGAGTGPITEALAQRLHSHTRLIAIERDPDFARILQERFAGRANIEIVHADVRQIDAILKARGIDEVDYMVSGLPTPTLPLGVRRRMFASVRRYLSPQGFFSNITEIPYLYLGYYKSVFRHVKFRFVPVNMPPGGVYHCRAIKV